MGVSGSQQRRGPGDHDDSEMIQFGGLPVRWPFAETHRPLIPRMPSAMRVRVTIAVAMLAVGLLVGFLGGRLTAHQSGPKAKSFSPWARTVVPHFATAAIELTGARCGVQIGNNLQLGVEIMNETQGTVTLGAIRPMFPLGGLRAISSGVGTCGALPANQIPPSTSLSPGATEWIYTTVAVRQACPEPLPVWFRVGYGSAGKTGTAVLAGFPDLGSVSYRRCQSMNQIGSSVIITNVEPATGHSSRR